MASGRRDAPRAATDARLPVSCGWSWWLSDASPTRSRQRLESWTTPSASTVAPAERSSSDRISRSEPIVRSIATAKAPTRKTRAVWEAVTVAPKTSACDGRARWPARYAPARALPWPGDSAWPAPSRSARPSAIAENIQLPLARRMADESAARRASTSTGGSGDGFAAGGGASPAPTSRKVKSPWSTRGGEEAALLP